MPVNILHLLSQNHLTGAEVYAVQLAHDQIHAGHTVIQVSNDFFAETSAQKIKLAVETKSKIEFIKNVFQLRDILIQNNIHVIHTHSRASAKLAYWARVGLKVGLLATVHGRQHPSFSKKLWNQYGDFIVTVCETLKAQLLKDFKYNPRHISVVRNAVSANDFYFSSQIETAHKKKIRIGIIGRTTGPKGKRTELVQTVLPVVSQQLGIETELVLVGSTSLSKLTSKDYVSFDLVIGSGRVAVESLLTGTPTICFGEASYLGLTRKENILDFMKSNFGDIEVDSQSPSLDLLKFKTDLENLLKSDFTLDERKEISSIVKSEFDSNLISKKILRRYQSCYFMRNYSKWIPTLMYHKIPNEELQSQHKIFVTKEHFRTHLQFFKDQGFTTLTFSDLKKYKSAERDFTTFPKKPLIITFDDGYVDNLENASPLLKEFGFKAQLFLLANSDINSNVWDHSETEKPHAIVSGADRLKWKKSAFEIGSHGFSHKKITQMSETEARQELKNSKLSLEKEFGVDIPVYAFTYGDTTEFHGKLALEEGYDYAVNTDTGGLLLEENPYQIFRVNIFPNETRSSLRKKTSTWYRRYYFWKRKK